MDRIDICKEHFREVSQQALKDNCKRSIVSVENVRVVTIPYSGRKYVQVKHLLTGELEHYILVKK